MKMNKEQLLRIISNTTERIKILLDIKDIPYEDGTHELNSFEGYEDEDPAFAVVTKQIRFPWCKGDVAIGTIHACDTDLVYGTVGSLKDCYPSIESYGFPWDDDDVTVFGDPESFVAAISEYYKDTTHGKLDRDPSEYFNVSQ